MIESRMSTTSSCSPMFEICLNQVVTETVEWTGMAHILTGKIPFPQGAQVDRLIQTMSLNDISANTEPFGTFAKQKSAVNGPFSPRAYHFKTLQPKIPG